VASDQLNNGLQADLIIDRDTASRLGVLPQAIDDTLYDAFGQRQVSTMVYAAQPVSRSAGSGSAIPDHTRRFEEHLRQVVQRGVERGHNGDEHHRRQSGCDE